MPLFYHENRRAVNEIPHDSDPLPGRVRPGETYGKMIP